MGLRTRLGLAQTLVFTGLQTDPTTLARLVDRFCRQHADLIVLWQPDAIGDDLLLGYRAGLQAMDGRAVLGVRADAQAVARSCADLVISAEGVRPLRGHRYGLAAVFADDPAALRQAVADAQVDAIVVSPSLVRVAAGLLPPAEPSSKPWFAMVNSIRAGRSAVQAGARRLAFEFPSGEDLPQYRELLAASWRDEMEAVALGSDRPQWGAPPRT